MEKVLPTAEFNTFGFTWSLNPGKFNMKEHMVITIMANVGFASPYTAYVSPACAISLDYPHNGRIRLSLSNTSLSTLTNRGLATSVTKVSPVQPLAWNSMSHPGTLVLVALSTNFIGYGLAGLTRRFLVYPSRAVWPSNLATIALNVSDSTHRCPQYHSNSLVACLPHGDEPTR